MEETSEDEDEVVNTPSVGEVGEVLGDMNSDEVEQLEKQTEVPNNHSTPLPLVEESTPQPDHAIFMGVMDPLEQYMEDISAKNGVLFAIKEQLGLEEPRGHPAGVELIMELSQPLFGQMHKSVTTHGWLNFKRVGVG